MSSDEYLYKQKERCGNCAYFVGHRGMHTDGTVMLGSGKCTLKYSYSYGKEQNGFGHCQYYERCGEFQRIITEREREKSEQERKKLEYQNRLERERLENENSLLREENQSLASKHDNYASYSYNDYTDYDDYDDEDTFDPIEYEKELKSILFDFEDAVDEVMDVVPDMRNDDYDEYEVNSSQLVSFIELIGTIKDTFKTISSNDELADADFQKRISGYKSKFEKQSKKVLAMLEKEIEWHLDEKHYNVAYALSFALNKANYKKAKELFIQCKNEYIEHEICCANELIKKKKYKDAISWLRLFKDEPRVSVIIEQCREELYNEEIKKARTYFDQGKYEISLKHLQDLKRTPDVQKLERECKKRINVLKIDKAKVLIEEKKYTDAKKVLDGINNVEANRLIDQCNNYLGINNNSGKLGYSDVMNNSSNKNNENKRYYGISIFSSIFISSILVFYVILASLCSTSRSFAITAFVLSFLILQPITIALLKSVDKKTNSSGNHVFIILIQILIIIICFISFVWLLLLDDKYYEGTGVAVVSIFCLVLSLPSFVYCVSHCIKK